jgi:hypothetical protein
MAIAGWENFNPIPFTTGHSGRYGDRGLGKLQSLTGGSITLSDSSELENLQRLTPPEKRLGILYSLSAIICREYA